MAEEIWSVRLPTGDVRRGTLDELDAAFEAGHIDENALVLAPGSTTWAKLGDLAGLDDDAPPAPPVSAYASPYASPNSLRPVMTDLDDLTFDEPRRRSKAPVFIGLLAAAAVVGGAIFAITKFGGADTSAATMAVMPPPPAPEPPAPPKEPVVETPVSTAPVLTDDQKKALAEIDKKNAKAAGAHKKSRDAAAAAAGGGGAHHRWHSGNEPTRKAGQACSCAHGDPLCTCL